MRWSRSDRRVWDSSLGVGVLSGMVYGTSGLCDYRSEHFVLHRVEKSLAC
jgi:hypothetical protein